MNEIKIGSVVRLKSDPIGSSKRLFTVVEASSDQIKAVGFNTVDGTPMYLEVPKSCVALILKDA